MFAMTLRAQPPSGKLQWVVQLDNGQIPVGKPAPDLVAIKENNRLYLLNLDGEKRPMSYDSIAHENGLFWSVWKGGLQGIYHLERGELIPAVYEHISPVSKHETNWAYEVMKYGMTAVVNSENKLVLPYTGRGYQSLALVSDSILEYFDLRKEVFYFSKNGNPVSVARLQKGPDFQRISAQQYVFSALVNGTVRRDTFTAAEKFTDGIAPVKKDQSWGYLLATGNWLIPPRFQAVLPFDEKGHAVVKENDKYGVVRKDGSYLIRPGFQFLKPFTPGLFEFKENGLTGLVDSLGKTILTPGEYGGFSMAGEECFTAKSGDSLLVFRNDGQLIPVSGLLWCSKTSDSPHFLAGQNLQADRAKTRRFFKGLMTPEGKWLIPPVMTGIVTESKKFVVAEAVAQPCCAIGPVNIGNNQPGKFLIFNRNAEPLVTTPVDAASISADGYFVFFEQGGKSGLVASPEEKLPAEFDELKSMGNGWVFVKKGNRYGALKWVE